MMKTKTFLVMGLILGIALFFFYSNNQKTDSLTVQSGENKITVFKSVNCGCCVGWISHLRKNGFEVEVINTDMDQIKKDHQIPRNMESCHTAIIGDYFVEGHVPIKAIEKLMQEKPDTSGIALPGMPSGSPGMPGYKKGEFNIYSITGGQPSEFMII